MTLDRFADLYRAHIVEPSLQPHFVVLASFLLTFVAVRLLTHRLRDDGSFLFFRNVTHGATHIHHLVPGILLLIGAGYVLATLDVPREAPAAAYGIGAALTLDEFALWPQLEDVYWTRDGRKSIDAVIIFVALAALGGVSARLLLALAREVLGGL